HLKRAAGTKMTPGVWDVLNPEDQATADVVLMASGGVMEPTMGAAQILSDKGVKPLVVNAAWIRPIDENFIFKANESKAKLLVTIEDHFDVGGLGGAVAEVLTQRGSSKPLERIGVTQFGQSGSPEANYEYYGFTAQKLADR